MAWLCKRAISGLQYTPLEFDQPEDYGREPWMAFLEGRDLFRPAGWLSSATQVRSTKGQLPDVFTERTHHLCNQRFKDLVEELEPNIHFFKPILLKRKNGDKIGNHYLWTVGQDIDCVLTEGWTRSGIPKPAECASTGLKTRPAMPTRRASHLFCGYPRGLQAANIFGTAVS